MSYIDSASQASEASKGFFAQFKPSRAPHLLVGIACVLGLLIISEVSISFYYYLWFFFPVASVFVAFSGLTFWFRPYAGAADSDQVLDEINNQFKFARTLCLAASVILITFLLYSARNQIADQEAGPFFWITYICCLAFVATFMCYMVIRTNREDTNLSIVQITFFTISVFAGLVLTASKLSVQQSLFYDCNHALEYVAKSDNTRYIYSKFPGNDAQVCTRDQRETWLEELREKYEGSAHRIYPDFKPVLDQRRLNFFFFFAVWAAFQIFWALSLFRSLPPGLVFEVENRTASLPKPRD